jgi:hypothetical protein
MRCTGYGAAEPSPSPVSPPSTSQCSTRPAPCTIRRARPFGELEGFPCPPRRARGGPIASFVQAYTGASGPVVQISQSGEAAASGAAACC